MKHDGELVVGGPVVGIVDRYDVTGVEGEGGFGIVYAGTRTSDGAAVVLKQLRLERLSDWKALERFEREAAVLRSLTHPRIPAFVELFAWDGREAHAPSAFTSAPEKNSVSLVLVQRRVPGKSLAAHIRDGKRFTPAEVEKLLRDMLAVLQYLHNLHPPVIHRDIHPGNVVIDDAGNAHLVDFGAIQDGLRLATGGTTQIGTVGYVPQEQALGRADARSDLYALGMTIAAAIAHKEPGAMPIDDRTTKVDVAKLASSLDPRIAKALSRMLEPAARDRVPTASAVVAILDRQPGASTWAFAILALLGVSLGTFALLAKPARPDPDAVPSTPATPATPPKKTTADSVYLGYSAPTGDVDGDGVRDILAWDHDRNTYAFSGRTGALIWENRGVTTSPNHVGLDLAVGGVGFSAFGLDTKTGTVLWRTQLDDNLVGAAFGPGCVVLAIQGGKTVELSRTGQRAPCPATLDPTRAAYRDYKATPLVVDGGPPLIFSNVGTGTPRLGVARLDAPDAGAKRRWDVTLDVGGDTPNTDGVAKAADGLLVAGVDREKRGYHVFLLDPETGETKKHARICSYVNVSVPKIYRLSPSLVGVHCDSELAVLDDSALEVKWQGGRRP